MSLAVFIQPEGSLLHDIKYWKAKINYEIPNQPYTIHPPHLTMINARFNNEKKLLNIYHLCLWIKKDFKF